MVTYLRRLKECLRGPLTVVWDRSRIHSRSKVVRAYLARPQEIVVEAFPGYVPELNPEEAVWGWTKYARSANLAADKADDLWDHVAEQLLELKFQPHLLASFIKQTKLPLRL